MIANQFLDSLQSPDDNRFRPAVATKFMQQILQTHLQHKVYNADEAQRMSKLIAEEVKAKLIGMQGRGSGTYSNQCKEYQLARKRAHKKQHATFHLKRDHSQFNKHAGRYLQAKYRKVSARHSKQYITQVHGSKSWNYPTSQQQKDSTTIQVESDI